MQSFVNCQLLMKLELKFSELILPIGIVSYAASSVNKLSVKTINGERRLCKENQPVDAILLEQALQKFLAFLFYVDRGLNRSD